MKSLAKKLPDCPGVYIFRGPKREVFYVGKATSLRTRVASYFRRDLIATRGPIIVGMVETARTVDFIETGSVLEALILEAHLIKKYQPPYNTKEKDNKSFNYVVVTKEDFPRVITMRARELQGATLKVKYSFGPFPQGTLLREALTIVRKIFPFRDKCTPLDGSPAYLFNQQPRVKKELSQKRLAGKPCFNAQIGLCPGICAGTVSKREYAKTIQRIKLFFEGKRKILVRSLERDMKLAAKNQKFEEAGRIKKMLFSLSHIQDVALLKSDFESKLSSAETFRIEAYDAAHISGTNTVGVMVVVEDGQVQKSQYRKFKIRTSTNDDNASLREVLSRRFGHTEWKMPKLIVVDGGTAQVNTAEKSLEEWGLAIPVLGVVKDEHHRPKNILGDKRLLSAHENAVLLANSEAHRFAIAYHRDLRGKEMRTGKRT